MNDNRLAGWLIALLIGAGLGIFLAHWYYTDNPVTETRTLIQKIPVNVPVAAPVAPQLAAAPIVSAKLKTCAVAAYASPKAARAHLLPQPVADDTKQVIVAASSIAPDEHMQTVTATVDTDTGKAVQSVVIEPLPWLAFNHKREASMDLIAKVSGPVLRLQLKQDLFEVKALHVRALAGGDVPVPIYGFAGKPDAYVGIGASYNF